MTTSAAAGAEQRLKDLHITLPAAPTPFGAYVEAVQTGNLLFMSGMSPPTAGRRSSAASAQIGRRQGSAGARLAAVNALGWRRALGSLDRVTRIVRLGVSIATSGDVRDQPTVADGASLLLQDVFGELRNPCRMVYGVASLPLGVAVELEVIFEVAE